MIRAARLFRRVSGAAVLAASLAATGMAVAEAPDGRISRPQLQLMFDQMRANAPWYVDGPLLWGYFFTASFPAPLKELAAELTQNGYRFVAIYESPPESGGWWLHVEKVEPHSVDSLHARNIELYAHASRYPTVAYDGMDVGAAK